MINSYIEEYNTLRDEIGRLQVHVSRALEFGIVITSGVLALSFSDFIDPSYRWLILFTPTLFLGPFAYMIAQSVRTTWIIGRYIEIHLEPELHLSWERFNRELRGKPNSPFFSRFAISLAAPLLIIQIICPLIALVVSPIGLLPRLLLVFLALVIVVVEFVYINQFATTDEMVAEIRETIHLIERKKAS
ncbi:MAG TPA: hypothetical protein VLA49_20605 [Anaerolineales bacterium]|nr:hypothetical protein [Anaerolineales bacterium]